MVNPGVAAEACTSILDLPTEILLLIFDLLRDEDFAALGHFRCASRTCRRLIDPVFYKDVSLHNWTDIAKDKRYNEQARYSTQPVEEANVQIRTLVLRLQDPRDGIRDTVKTLKFGPFNKGVAILSVACISAILVNLRALRCIHWNTGLDPPDTFLQLLAQHHPSADLHISQLTRYNSILNEELVAYPRLKSLELRILEHGREGWGEAGSEFPVVNQQLAHGLHLTSLALMTDSMKGVYHTDYTELKSHPERYQGPRCLTLHENVRPLKRLSIDEGFDISCHAGQHWLRMMDWSQLEFLDVSSKFARHLIVGLTGRVPQLRCMDIALHAHDPVDRAKNIYLEDLHLLEAFFESAQSLEDVACDVWDMKLWRETLQILLRYNGNKLSRLSVRTHSDTWNVAQLEALNASAPNLSELAVEIRLDPVGKGQHRCAWSEDLSRALGRFRKLRRLYLALPIYSLHRYQEHPFYRDGSEETINLEHVDSILLSLFQGYLQVNAFHPIEMIALLVYDSTHFWGRNLNWRVQARRLFAFPREDHPLYHTRVLQTGAITPYPYDCFGK